jgi:ABC-type uncharacterized transport system involved in gliding motility auxiliary subunit
MTSAKNLKYGSVSIAITFLVIISIIMINILLGFLFKKYPLTIDLTENKVYEISGETKQLLAYLNRDVRIYVMNTEAGFASSVPQQYYVQANEVIRKYAQYSSRIRIEYVDIVRNPGFGSRYPQEDIAVNDVIVSAGEKYRALTQFDLFNIRTSFSGDYVASSGVEQAITSALLGVSSDKNYLVAALTGHGEQLQELEAFFNLLRLNNYEIININLLTGEIPPETSVLVIAAPSRDIPTEELRKIDAFLGGGANRVLYYLASVEQSNLINLEEYLEEWGIAVDRGVIFETNTSRLVSNTPFVAFVDYAEHNYSKNTARKDLTPLIPSSRPLRAVFDRHGYRSVTSLLQFSSHSGIYSENDFETELLEVTGNIPALMLSSQTRSNAERIPQSAHVLVLGSIYAMGEGILANPNIANAEYFLNLLSILTGREDQIYIPDKTIGFTGLGANFSQIIIITIIFMALLPLVVFSAGIFVWLRRRHK